MKNKEHNGFEMAKKSVFADRGADAGFTLLELVVTAALIGTLSMIVIPRLFGYAERVRSTQAEVDIAEMDADLAQYGMDYNDLPDSLADVGLDGLVDPWGRPYEYLKILGVSPTPPGQRKDHFLVPVNSDYDLYSVGPDGKTGAPFTAAAARDDIVRASNGSFIGPVSEF
jgi:general secretion pathway protein G